MTGIRLTRDRWLSWIVRLRPIFRLLILRSRFSRKKVERLTGTYQGVADVLYYGDGVQLLKYVIQAPPATPAQGTTFNWGITPAATWYTPTQNLTNSAQTYTIVNSQGTTLGVPPVIITETGSAAQQWVDGTEFSTMGIIRVNDTTTSTEYLFQLVSVNAEPVLDPNTTQIGLTGNGQPFWDSVPPGGTVADSGGWNWTNWGPIVEWSANTVYNNATIGGNKTQILVSSMIQVQAVASSSETQVTIQARAETLPRTGRLRRALRLTTRTRVQITQNGLTSEH